MRRGRRSGGGGRGAGGAARLGADAVDARCAKGRARGERADECATEVGGEATGQGFEGVSGSDIERIGETGARNRRRGERGSGVGGASVRGSGREWWAAWRAGSRAWVVSMEGRCEWYGGWMQWCVGRRVRADMRRVRNVAIEEAGTG